jgi:hypothetical protein
MLRVNDTLLRDWYRKDQNLQRAMMAKTDVTRTCSDNPMPIHSIIHQEARAQKLFFMPEFKEVRRTASF